MSLGNILVAQGGGPTAVINQSLAGVVLEARRHKGINRVYGALYGVQGILMENFVDLSEESELDLEKVARTPSSALGASRDQPDAWSCQEMFQVLKVHGIRQFFFIGGDGAAVKARYILSEAERTGYPLHIIHIPKTIDNDLAGSDHTPGFPSAARFVIQAFIGVNLDNASMPGVYVGVVMGRNAGFLTASSALARKYPDDGPHLIYLPERAFSMERFLSDVQFTYEKHGRCVIAVSEGIRDASGTPILGLFSKAFEKDAYGNLQLSGTGTLADLLCEQIRSQLRIKRVRGDTLGYLQRSFIGCVSDVDQHEAREVGRKAVQFAVSGRQNGSVAIRRTGSYSVDYELLELDQVAEQIRTMDDRFIAESGTDVTEEFRSYLQPLLGTRMPQAFHLRQIPVPKIIRSK